MCLQSCLQTSPPTPQKSYPKFQNEVKQPVKYNPIGDAVGIVNAFYEEADLISDAKNSTEAEVEILVIVMKTEYIQGWMESSKPRCLMRDPRILQGLW